MKWLGLKLSAGSGVRLRDIRPKRNVRVPGLVYLFTSRVQRLGDFDATTLSIITFGRILHTNELKIIATLEILISVARRSIDL